MKTIKKSLLFVIALAASTQLAWAAVQTIEPDDYASGADIVYPGVTLEMRNYQIPFTIPVMSIELGADYSSTGVRNFGGGFHNGQQFIALFNNPISFFAIDVVNDDQGLGTDSAILAAYDKDGISLGYSDWVTVPATPWPGFRTISISGSGIARVDVISDEWIQLDNLRFSVAPLSAVPEPSPFVLFAIGLSVMGLLSRRSKSCVPARVV
ncbi:MAG: PEP-CTERM sorting domain-containing protein [Propionivibrio sp.]|uniref:PEP-CTERM sorting domain-containing protein n=1 Tax=Propionivibrio sp. TaxID=2212460 RepID=UPI001A4D22C9|nr:PEP-CTERM sorting domain-containing protein [Propionivibrio sp.]MBL8415529.1 PEP-CTERM sorting domain-containing protein [Propionivibrio sp.]